jgi:hypothetical protein
MQAIHQRLQEVMDDDISEADGDCPQGLMDDYILDDDGAPLMMLVKNARAPNRCFQSSTRCPVRRQVMPDAIDSCPGAAIGLFAA